MTAAATLARDHAPAREFFSEHTMTAAAEVRGMRAHLPERPPFVCQPPELLDCPRGCGFATSARAHLRLGPWRMQVHLMNPRCPAHIPGIGTYRANRRAR